MRTGLVVQTQTDQRIRESAVLGPAELDEAVGGVLCEGGEGLAHVPADFFLALCAGDEVLVDCVEEDRELLRVPWSVICCFFFVIKGGE
jgi:hypothetical protein